MLSIVKCWGPGWNAGSADIINSSAFDLDWVGFSPKEGSGLADKWPVVKVRPSHWVHQSHALYSTKVNKIEGLRFRSLRR